MKRYIFTAFALAAVVIGCTKSSIVDVPEVQKTPITFETYTGKTPVTKATEVTTDILKESTKDAPGFQVKAFLPSDGTNPHMNEPVWYTTSGWEYDGTAYWPNDGKLNFVAYGLNAAIDFNGSQTSGTYTVSPKVADQEDLIVAVPQNTQEMPSEGKVELIFKHLLTRIGFTLKTTVQNEVNVYIKKIVLNGKFYESCTVDLTAGTPAVSNQSTDVTSYSLFDGTAYNIGATSGKYNVFQANQVPESGVGIYANNTLELSSDPDITDAYAPIEDADPLDRYMMLIPGNDVKPISVEIIYQLAGAEDQHVVMDLTAAGVLPFTNFEAGKAYEFVIKLSTDAIVFDCAEIPGWGNAEEVTPEAAN